MKRKVALLLLAALVCRLCALPAALNGTVSGAKGEPVPFAAIYFKDLRRGVSADSEGHFLLELPEGKHDCRVAAIVSRRGFFLLVGTVVFLIDYYEP